MSKRYIDGSAAVAGKVLCVAVLAAALLATSGCNEKDDVDGTVITSIALPTDTLLDLTCPDMGIYTERCVLTDSNNPFANATIVEFDVGNPGAENKFQLAASIPQGPTGAKARVYFWATALARRTSGENQWYTARALHELFDANNDPVIQAQALRAYRTVLDFFFGSATFFECCANLDPDGQPVAFPASLNELVADNVYRTESTGWARLVPGDPLLTLALFGEWGYTYLPASPPDFNDGVLSINGG